MSVPEVGDDYQQVECHSEQSDAVQQDFDKHGLGSIRHQHAGDVVGMDTAVSCFQCLHHHQRQ